jgi:hypothetical protein
MTNKPPIIDYAPRLTATRRWGMSRRMWWVLASFCAVIHLYAWFAMNGRRNSVGDNAVLVVLGAIGLVALINAIRPLRQAG